MSILNAMYSGVSGLSAEGEALGVVGDNIANTSTVGFKESRAVFEDVLGSAVGSAHAAGGGVRMERSQQIFAQGALNNTGQPTDLAISGDGFFVVHGMVDGSSGDYYTRAGQMTLAKDGTLVNPEGMTVQGYAANPPGGFVATLSAITVPTSALAPKVTANMAVVANVDAGATPPTLPWDPQSPGATSNFSTSMKVFDSLGNSHSVDVYFRNTGAGTWDVHALAAGKDVVGGTVGQNSTLTDGTMTFGTGGALTATTGTAITAAFNGAAPQAITLNLGTPAGVGGSNGLNGITQFGSPSSVSSQQQDGYASGDLTGVKVDGSGVVSGIYSNGEQVSVGQLAIAKFRSNDGLGRAGHNLWTATRDSGEVALGASGTGGTGAVVSGALEQSTVDIAQQFVDLIAHQRAFQANSKTITTADQMLQELINIKQ